MVRELRSRRLGRGRRRPSGKPVDQVGDALAQMRRSIVVAETLVADQAPLDLQSLGAAASDLGNTDPTSLAQPGAVKGDDRLLIWRDGEASTVSADELKAFVLDVLG